MLTKRLTKVVMYKWLVENHLEVASFAVLVALLLWPLLPLGPTHSDDAMWIVRSHQEGPSQVLSWATSQGRVWPLVSGYILQFILDAQGGAIGAFLRYAPFVLFLGLSTITIAVRFGNRAAGAFAAIYISLFAVRWDGSLLTTYPGYTWLLFSSFLGSTLLSRRYLEEQRGRTLAVASSLLFLSLFVNEGLAVLFSILWTVDLLVYRAGFERPSWRTFVSSPVARVALAGALSIGAYVILYAGWRLTHGNTYEGLKVAPFSISRILHTLFPFALSGSILYDVFSTIRVTYVEAGLKGGVQQFYPPGSYLWIGKWSVSQIMAALASFTLMFRALRPVGGDSYLSRQKLALLAIVGFLAAFIPIVPVSLSSQYQNWANEMGVRSYSHTVVSHTGVCLLIVSVILLIDSKSGTARRAFRVCVAALVALTAGTSAGMNHDVAASMWADSGRWPIVRNLIESKPDLCGKGATVWAPRLWEGTWYTVVGPGYWTDYSRFVLGCELSFVGTGTPFPSTVRPLYFLDYHFPSEQNTAVASIAQVQTAASPKQFIATNIDVLSIGLSRLARSTLHLSYRTSDGVIRQRALSGLWQDGSTLIALPLDDKPPLDTLSISQHSTVTMPDVECKWPHEIGEVLRFNETDLGCSATATLKSGWYAPEHFGTWSKGATSIIEIPLASIPHSNLTVDLNIESYTSLFSSKVTQSVRLDVNGANVGEWFFEHGRNAVQRRFTIPATMIKEPRLVLTFHVEKPVIPKTIGMGEDQRELGLNLRTVRITE